jgi:hypothetical protein
MRDFLLRLWRCQHGGPLFGGSPKPPAPPPPQPMPDLMDPAVMEARKRTLQAAMGRSGRASTNLTGDNGDYSADKLGSR